MSNNKLNLTYFTFPELTEPKGMLTRELGCQACWYFYLLAEQLRRRVGNSTEDQFGLLDGELWMDKNYVQIAQSIALMYQLQNPDEFAKFWPKVTLQARAIGYPPPHPEYMRLAPRSLII